MHLRLMVVLPNMVEKKNAQGPVFLLWRLSLGLDPGLTLQFPFTGLEVQNGDNITRKRPRCGQHAIVLCLHSEPLRTPAHVTYMLRQRI